MNTTSLGRQAETVVAKYLENSGYKILAKNWRTRVCEIDLVAQKDERIYFVEVKYRVGDEYGTGAEFVTAKKIRQMQFAAEVWASQNDWQGDQRLMVASVSGDGFSEIELIELD